MIDEWIGHYNKSHQDNVIIDEDRVFKFFDNILKSNIQFSDQIKKPSIKDGIKTAYNLLGSISDLSPYYKRKYDNLLKPLTEGLTFDIQSLQQETIRTGGSELDDKKLKTIQCLRLSERINSGTNFVFIAVRSNNSR